MQKSSLLLQAATMLAIAEASLAVPATGHDIRDSGPRPRSSQRGVTLLRTKTKAKLSMAERMDARFQAKHKK